LDRVGLRRLVAHLPLAVRDGFGLFVLEGHSTTCQFSSHIARQELASASLQ
jgi:hypothetical protein